TSRVWLPGTLQNRYSPRWLRSHPGNVGPSKIEPTNKLQGGHDDRNQRRSHDPPRRAGKRTSRRERRGLGRRASADAPKTFVLVHGAWHGGWCWRRVADRLQKGRAQGVHANDDRVG